MNRSEEGLVPDKSFRTASGTAPSATMVVITTGGSTQGDVQELTAPLSEQEQRIMKNRADIDAGKATKYDSIEEYINSLEEESE